MTDSPAAEVHDRLRAAALRSDHAPPVDDSTLLADLTAGDRLATALVRAELRALLPNAAPELLSSIETVGEVASWHEAAADRGDELTSEPSWSACVDAMTTSSARLRPLVPADVAFMYRAMMDPRWSHKWRYRGQTPSPPEFEASLFHGAFSQYVVTATATGAIVGLVTAYDARLDSGFSHLSLTRLVESRPDEPLLFLGGAALFVSLLFRNWNFRKVYAEIPGVTWPQFSAGAGTIFDVEAVIPERDYFDGEYLDARIVSISRARWQEFTGRFGRLLA